MSRKAFISYARVDVETARRLFDHLKNSGYEPWLDEKNLLEGQNCLKALKAGKDHPTSPPTPPADQTSPVLHLKICKAFIAITAVNAFRDDYAAIDNIYKKNPGGSGQGGHYRHHPGSARHRGRRGGSGDRGRRARGADGLRLSGRG